MTSLKRFFGGSSSRKSESISDEMVVVSKVSFTEVDDLVLITNDDSPVNSLAASASTEAPTIRTVASSDESPSSSLAASATTEAPLARHHPLRPPTSDVLDNAISVCFALIGVNVEECMSAADNRQARNRQNQN